MNPTVSAGGLQLLSQRQASLPPGLSKPMVIGPAIATPNTCTCTCTTGHPLQYSKQSLPSWPPPIVLTLQDWDPSTGQCRPCLSTWEYLGHNLGTHLPLSYCQCLAGWANYLIFGYLHVQVVRLGVSFSGKVCYYPSLFTAHVH